MQILATAAHQNISNSLNDSVDWHMTASCGQLHCGIQRACTADCIIEHAVAQQGAGDHAEQISAVRGGRQRPYQVHIGMQSSGSRGGLLLSEAC